MEMLFTSDSTSKISEIKLVLDIESHFDIISNNILIH